MIHINYQSGCIALHDVVISGNCNTQSNTVSQPTKVTLETIIMYRGPTGRSLWCISNFENTRQHNRAFRPFSVFLCVFGDTFI